MADQPQAPVNVFARLDREPTYLFLDGYLLSFAVEDGSNQCRIL